MAAHLFLECGVFFIAHVADLVGKSPSAHTAAASVKPAPPEEPEKEPGNQEEKEHVKQKEGHKECECAKQYTEYDRPENGLVHDA